MANGQWPCGFMAYGLVALWPCGLTNMHAQKTSPRYLPPNLYMYLDLQKV